MTNPAKNSRTMRTLTMEPLLVMRRNYKYKSILCGEEIKKEKENSRSLMVKESGSFDEHQDIQQNIA